MFTELHLAAKDVHEDMSLSWKLLKNCYNKIY